VIPCGGLGSRMASVAGTLPKELLPVAGKPVLQWTLDEAAAAGIERAIVVTSPGKPGIAHFLSTVPTVHLSVSLVVQPEPRGLGDALTCARPVLGGDDVGVLLPDNLFARPGPMASVLDAYRRTGESSVLLAEVPAAKKPARGATGRASCRRRGDGLWDVLTVAEKAPAEPSTLTPIGRWVFAPPVFERFERLRSRLPAGAELDDVPVLQELAGEGRLIGVPLAGVFYDVGQPAGYLEATHAF
jgi:UTP--glucose-1-phosphate uridylyltransferase